MYLLFLSGEAALQTTYIGCFNDGDPKDLPDGTHLAHYMQLETCAALCAAKGFKYFGAQVAMLPIFLFWILKFFCINLYKNNAHICNIYVRMIILCNTKTWQIL